MIAVFIPGKSETQGSIAFRGMTSAGKPILTCDNPRTYSWRNQVRSAILDNDGQPKARFEGPVHLEIEFVLPRPASASKKKDIPADRIRSSDIDKLERSILDSISDTKVRGRLVLGVLRNDVQVVSVNKVKRVAKPGETPGCHLEIMEAKE
jgi:crossover junction endodeoxyribonuclease RusA